GIAPVLLGAVTLIILPDRPADARWLSPADKEWLDAELSREAPHGDHHVAQLAHAVGDARLWLLSTLYFMLIMGLYGFVYWLPSIIKSVTEASDLTIGFISAGPYGAGAITMVLIGRHADRHNERRWHIAACATLAALGIAIVWSCLDLFHHGLGIDSRGKMLSVMAALCIAAVAI